MHLLFFNTSLETYMLPCLNQKLFGFDCLGCGFQRATLFLVQSEFLAAFKMYPAIYLMLFTVLFLIVNRFYKFKSSLKIVRYLAISILFTIVIQYTFKMNLFI